MDRKRLGETMRKIIKTDSIEIKVGKVLSTVWRHMDDHEQMDLKNRVASILTYYKYKQEDRDKADDKEKDKNGLSSLTWRDGV